MSECNAAKTVQPDLATWTEGLEKILRAQIDGYQKLLACMSQKRQAIRSARLESIRDVSTLESALMQRLLDLEKRRADLTHHLGGLLSPNEKRPVTISEITADSRIPEQQRDRIAVFAAQLRELLSQVKRESSIVRTAAEMLARHMSGIVQSVHAALSRTRVYSARGGLQSVGALSVIDLKS